MMRMKLSSLVLCIGLTSSVHAWAQESGSSYKLKQVQAGIVFADQAGGTTQTGVIKYTPRYRLNSKFSLGVDLGFSYFKRYDGVEFPVFQYFASIDYGVSEAWVVRGKVGAETWGEDQGTKLAVGAEAGYKLPKGLGGLKWIDEAFLSYTSVSQKPSANEFIVGLGAQF